MASGEGNAPPNCDGVYEAAVAFATEFARLGYPATRVMELFADPFYAPAHAALARLGEPAVREIVADAVRHRAGVPRYDA